MKRKRYLLLTVLLCAAWQTFAQDAKEGAYYIGVKQEFTSNNGSCWNSGPAFEYAELRFYDKAERQIHELTITLAKRRSS